MEQKHNIQMISLNRLTVKKNVRTTYNENKIEELAASIRKQGLLQPITVTPNMIAGYDIIFGHRRFMAYQKLAENAAKKYAAIPCIIREDINEEEVIELQLIENIQRENISAVDLKKSLTELRNRGQSNEDIAKQLGKSLGYVKNLFSAIKTINENTDLETFLEENEKITITDVREVKGLPSKEQLRLLKLRAAGNIGSIKQLKEEITKYKNRGEQLSKDARQRGRRKFTKSLYIHSNYLVSLPCKYAIPEMTDDERRETAEYLRTLAEKIDL